MRCTQVDNVSSCLNAYHQTGMVHQEATAKLVSAMKSAAVDFIVDGTRRYVHMREMKVSLCVCACVRACTTTLRHTYVQR